MTDYATDQTVWNDPRLQSVYGLPLSEEQVKEILRERFVPGTVIPIPVQERQWTYLDRVFWFSLGALVCSVCWTIAAARALP
jgi:hypothetical protein